MYREIKGLPDPDEKKEEEKSETEENEEMVVERVNSVEDGIGKLSQK